MTSPPIAVGLYIPAYPLPTELVVEGPLMWGTPEQVASKLRAFGEVGLRHVVLVFVSPAISKRAAIYGLQATSKIARLLGNRR